MPISVTSRGIVGQAADDLARLEALTADFGRIIDGYRPTERDLRDAPTVDRWAISQRPHLCLTGDLYGHPILDAQTVVTSDLWVIAPDLGWARTFSRFYRFGRHRAGEGFFGG